MEKLSAESKENWLSWFFRGLIILGFLLLFARLIELQLIKGNYYRVLSDQNRIRKIPILAPRGKILARGGEILVGNKEVKKAIVFNPETGFEKRQDWQGINPTEIISEWVRDYPLGSKFAHVSGYLGEVNKDEVGKINPSCLDKGPRKLGSLVGRGGLEEEYECVLAGIDGEELIEVDTLGQKIRVLGKKNPVSGEDLKTSIDFGLQQKLADFMEGKKGAVVATDTNGEVIAFYSSPSFDQNTLINKSAGSEIVKILKDENLPFFNRAIGGQFHPGSVFKPIVAVAALSEGKIDKNFTFDDPGIITIDKYSYSNWFFSQHGKTEGTIGVIKALARSTDTFFYKLGEFLGAEKLSQWAGTFGLDQKSGIDIPGEIGGLVPSPDWKLKVKGEPWFLGNTYHMAIGQGDLAVTPLEINQAISTIASGGKFCQPKIVGKPSCLNLSLKKENLTVVKEGMVDVCRPGGTGFTFFDFGNPVACKTGTAETNQDGKTHAWFVAFSPTDFPEIVLTVLVERGGEGSKVAGPIARKILDYWYNRTN